MGRFPWGLGPQNVYLFFSLPVSAVERKEPVGAKESLVLEIILSYGSALKEFVKYISFRSEGKYEEIVIKVPKGTKPFRAPALPPSQTW